MRMKTKNTKTLRIEFVLAALVAFGIFACKSESEAQAHASGSGESASQPDEPGESGEAAQVAQAGATEANTEEPTVDEAEDADAPGMQIGDTAPMLDEAMRNVDESQVSIRSVAQEHGTLVVFTCNHCPYSRAWEQRIAELGNTYMQRGVGVIAINSNDPAMFAIDDFAPMQERAASLGMNFPYVVDSTSDVARAFDAQKTPEVYLLDADMRLVYRGAVDDNTEAGDVQRHFLRDALDALIEGRPIDPAETRAIGCSIKFRDPPVETP